MKLQKTFISKKFFSMLLSGTMIMALASFIGIIDILLAGSMLGKHAVEGINLVLPLYNLSSFFGVCLSYGVPILYSGEIGAFRRKEGDQCFGVGLSVTIVIGVISFVALMFFGDLFLMTYNPGKEIFANAKAYLFWIAFVMLLLPLNELMNGMVFADGDETVTTISNVCQGVLKVILSVFLCIKMGVGGLALASFISITVSTLILFLHFFRKTNSLRLNLAFSGSILKKAINFGIVDASTYLYTAIFTAALNHYVIAAFGAHMLIFASLIRLLKETQLVFDGIGEAFTPIISTYLGEETYPGVKKVWGLALWTLRIESLIVTAALCLGAPFVVKLIGFDDPTLVKEAAWCLRLLSLTLVFTGRMFLDAAYFILVKKIPLGVFVAFLRDLFPALLLAFLGGQIGLILYRHIRMISGGHIRGIPNSQAGGVLGMFIGLMLAPVLGHLISVMYIRYKYGPENYPLFIADKEKGRTVKFYEFTISPESVVNTRDQIGMMLAAEGCSQSLATRTMTIFEELSMFICESNPGKTVLAECTVEPGEMVHLIMKDDGIVLDLTNTDQKVCSLNSYVLSNLLNAHSTNRVHFLALSFNRNVIDICE